MRLPSLTISVFAAVAALAAAPPAHAGAPVLVGGLAGQNDADGSCSGGCGGWFDWGTGASGLPCQNGFAASFYIRGTDANGVILNPHLHTACGGYSSTITPLSATLQLGANDFTVVFGANNPWQPVT